ncbi:MAG: DUF309 domain-containing protein [Planctomycetes bacterium]|nr:DUF309 domain-containing protein [Planctomycetota bacterium]MCB9904582.1 DUF309 domain-containing protein [Planctomycetota bacterium]
MTDLPRYAPGRAFPPYAFLPGRDPHPRQDPRGHSFGTVEAIASEAPHAENWRASEDYLHGVDLYNHGYLWEAHEAWEGLWHPAKQADPELAAFLQGLIQCSASSLKARMGEPRGHQKLAELALAKLAAVAEEHEGRYMGLALFEFVADFRAFVAEGSLDAERRPLLVLGD